MSDLIINKGSSKYAVLSLGIALFLFMFFFTFLFLGDQMSSGTPSKTVVLYELKKGHPANALELLTHDIKVIETLDIAHSEMISKDKAPDFFKEELDVKLIELIKKDNPFKDILKFEINGDLSNNELQSLRMLKSKNDNFVSDVRIEYSKQNFNPIQDGLSKVLIPFLAICLIFCVVIVTGSINSDLSLNKLSIQKSAIAGVHPKVLYNNVRAIMLSNFVKSIILALVLYFLTFYLISRYLGVNFSDFGLYIFVKPIFTSILLILVGLILLTHYKVSNFLKSI